MNQKWNFNIKKKLKKNKYSGCNILNRTIGLLILYLFITIYKMSKIKDLKHDILFKIIIIGDSGVGKSCLMAKYVQGIFPISQIPTIAVEFATKIIEYNGKKIKSQIWDTAGQEKYRSITSYHYRKAVGALLVYDITKKSSFKSLQKWLIELRQFAEPDCLISLVGNKVDLVQNNPELREVSYEEAKRFADENKLILFETSAMINLQVNEAFDDLVKEIYKSKDNQNVKRSNRYGNVIKLSSDSDNERANCC